MPPSPRRSLSLATHRRNADIKDEFRAAPKDKLAAVGDTVTFDCLPQAWPEPAIQWRHDGRLIEPDEFKLADASAKYSLNKIAKADLNMAPPASPSWAPPAPASNASSAAAASADANANAKLSQPSAQMAAHIREASGGATNGPDNQLIDVIGSQLVIRQVDKSDEGKYSCVVETRGSHRLIERESASAHLSALGECFNWIASQSGAGPMGARFVPRGSSHSARASNP